MWILLDNSFLSIVKDPKKKKNLLVRARIKGDIEKIFKSAEVVEGAGTDYQYRASIPCEVVQVAMMREIHLINYTNFKDSVPAGPRHLAYLDVWTTLRRSFAGL